MNISLSTLKVAYSMGSVAITAIGYFISYLLEFETTKDLAEMFFGSSMISISIVFMTVDSQAYCTDKYPYSYLISLISFTLLTFFTFIKDSVALLDDTLLFKCDIANSSTLPVQDEPVQNEEEIPKFSILDNLVSSVLFIISCVESAAFGGVIACFKTEDDMNGRLPYILAVRLIQIVCISTYLKDMNMHWAAYLVMCVINSVCPAIFGVFQQLLSDRATDVFFAVSSSLLLGCFLYFGATAIHNSRISFTHSSFLSILFSLIGFVLPIVFRIFMKDPSK